VTQDKSPGAAFDNDGRSNEFKGIRSGYKEVARPNHIPFCDDCISGKSFAFVFIEFIPSDRTDLYNPNFTVPWWSSVRLNVKPCFNVLNDVSDLSPFPLRWNLRQVNVFTRWRSSKSPAFFRCDGRGAHCFSIINYGLTHLIRRV